MNIRIYIRVSTKNQDLTRQEKLIDDAKKQGYYIAGIYREIASGTITDRPELTRLIGDLQEGDIIICENIDRLSRLPLDQAEQLIQTITNKGAKLSIPGIVDLASLKVSDSISRIVIESIQEMLLKIALQIARDDYETRKKRQLEGIAIAKEKNLFKGRSPNIDQHKIILTLRKNHTIAETARLANCSIAQVKRVQRLNNATV